MKLLNNLFVNQHETMNMGSPVVYWSNFGQRQETRDPGLTG